MQVPDKCPECGEELEYLADIDLCSKEETGFEGTCFKCGAIVYSKFKIYEIEVTLFDDDGNEIGKKKI